MDRKQIGLRIKKIRDGLGDTQAEFADRFSRTQQAVGQWESGVTMPDGETMIRIMEMSKERLPMLSDNEDMPETFKDGLGRDIKIEDAVKMMTDIMDGPAIYRAALVTSVKALFKAGRNEMKLEALEGRVSKIEDEIMSSQNRIEGMLASFLSAFEQKGVAGEARG